MSARRLIDSLERKQLLSPAAVAELRRQLDKSDSRLTAESVAKVLVDNDQLTKFQATQLIAELNSGRFEDDPTLVDEGQPAIAEVEDPDVDEVEIVDDADDGPIEVSIDPARVGYDDDDEMGVDDVVVLEDDAAAAAVGDVQVVEDRDEQAFAPGTAGLARPVRKTSTVAAPTRWDAIRTYGVATTLAILTVLGIFLVFWYYRGSAEEMLGSAQEAYDKQQYKTAIDRYGDFLQTYPTHTQNSYARSLIAIANIRQTLGQGDPIAASEVAARQLPQILDESQLADVRPDMAGVLINIGEEMVKRGEAAKTQEERRKYADALSEHMRLVNDTQLIASAERRQLEYRIVSLEESRQRLLRDIQRTEDRSQTLAAMKAALDKRSAQEVYVARYELIRRHPQLLDDAEVNDLLASATEVVRNEVTAATNRPRVLSSEAAAEVVPSPANAVALFAGGGTPLVLQDPQSLFFRIKESVFCVDAASGELRWRRPVGSREAAEPVRLEDDASAPGGDALVMIPDRSLLLRLSGADGSIIWAVDFGSRPFMPAVDRDQIFVSDASGRVTALASADGAVRWCQQLPQPISCGVGLSRGSQFLVAVGDSANVYLLSRRDGEAVNVHYLSHSPGTVQVAPVMLLDRVMVFENIDPRRCRLVHLRFGDDGSTLDIAQDSAELRGNVTVAPESEGRRVVVVTNLGEIRVFEVETVEDSTRVELMASSAPTETSPSTFYPKLVGSDLWLAADQLTKFQIQTVQQKLVRVWVKMDGDQFITTPRVAGDALIHCRVLRGTEGARIVASRIGDDGEAWQTTVAAPIVSAAIVEGNVVAIDSQASLFRTPIDQIGPAEAVQSTENAGRNLREQTFDRLVRTDDGRVAAVNSFKGNSLMYFDPNASGGRTLTTLAAATGDAPPSGDPLWLPSGLLVPQRDGQLSLVDPQTGRLVGAPIQTPMKPGELVSWSSPVLAADGTTVIAASSDKRLVKIAANEGIAQASVGDMSNAFSGDPVILDQSVLVPTSGKAGNFVEVYSLAKLERQAIETIHGTILWGAKKVGDVAIVYSDVEGLIALDAAGKRRWVAKLPKMQPVGDAVVDGSAIVLAAASGRLFRIDAASGNVTGTLEAGEPISGTPVPTEGGYLLPGDEGTLATVSASDWKEPQP